LLNYTGADGLIETIVGIMLFFLQYGPTLTGRVPLDSLAFSAGLRYFLRD
jgi:hypothetical protein